MLLEKRLDEKVRTMVAGLGPEFHGLRHSRIDDLGLHGPSREERAPVPLGHAPRGDLDAAAERSVVGLVLLVDDVEVVGFETPWPARRRSHSCACP